MNLFGNNCGCNRGIFGGNDSILWFLILVLLIFCNCGNNDNDCGCGCNNNNNECCC